MREPSSPHGTVMYAEWAPGWPMRLAIQKCVETVATGAEIGWFRQRIFLDNDRNRSNTLIGIQKGFALA